MVRSETGDAGGPGPATKRARSIPAEPSPVPPDSCNPPVQGQRSVVAGGSSVAPAQTLGWQEALHLLSHGQVVPRPPQLQHTPGVAQQIFLERPMQKRIKGHDRWVGSGGRKGSTEHWLGDDIGIRKRYGKVTRVGAGSPSLKYTQYSRLRRIPASAGATGTADVPGQVVEDKSTALFVTTSQPASTTAAAALFNECPPASRATSRVNLSVGHVRSMAPTASETPDDGTLCAMFRTGQVREFAAVQRLVALLGPAGDSLPERPLVIEDQEVERDTGMIFREAGLRPMRRYKPRKSGDCQIDVWKPYGGTSTTRLVLPLSLQPLGVDGPQEIIRRSGKITRTNGKTSLRYRQYELSTVGDKISPNTGHTLFHVLQSTLGARRKACAAGPKVKARKPMQAKEPGRNGGPSINAETLEKHNHTQQLVRPLSWLADARSDMVTSSNDWVLDTSCSSSSIEEMDADTSWDDAPAVESHPNIQELHSESSSSPECVLPASSSDWDGAMTNSSDWEFEESCISPEPFNVGDDWGSDEIWSDETNAEAESGTQECGSQCGSDHDDVAVSVHGEWSNFNEGAEPTAPPTPESQHLLPTPLYLTYSQTSAAAVCSALCINTIAQQLQTESGTESAFLQRRLQDTDGAEFSLLVFDSKNFTFDARVSSGLSFPSSLHPFAAVAEALGAWADYGLSSAFLVHFEIFTVFMLMVGVAVDAVLDLDYYSADQKRICRLVSVLSRLTPIRCLLYIRILRVFNSAFSPLLECAVHVLLLIAVGVVAYKFYGRPHISAVAGPRQRKPMELIGMARGLLFCWAIEHTIALVAIDPSMQPFVFTDDAIASFARVCAIVAVRFSWGALNLYRALGDELEGKTHDWGRWLSENPESKIAMAMLPMPADKSEAFREIKRVKSPWRCALASATGAQVITCSNERSDALGTSRRIRL